MFKQFCLAALAAAVIGCSAPIKLKPNVGGLKRTAEFNYLETGVPGCDKAVTAALNYYQSIGVGIKISPQAKPVFLCLPSQPGWSVLIGGPAVHGLGNSRVAWAEMRKNDEHNAKVVIHELCHMLFGCTHSTGIMAAEDTFIRMATGFSESTMNEIFGAPESNNPIQIAATEEDTAKAVFSALP